VPPEETILDEAKRLVFGNREEDYDHPKHNGERFAALMNAYYGAKLGVLAPFAPKDYAIVMILAKLTREQFAHRRDNLVDIAGYAEVLARIEGDDA
jgi:hypothetical protein